MKTTYSLVLLLMSGQILLGFIWLCTNLSGYPLFAESIEFFDISNTWILDEYVGIGYPFILWIMGGIESFMGIPYQIPIYILQIVLAFFIGRYFLIKSKVVDGEHKEIAACFGSLYILTVPMILQCHMAVLAYSISFSLLLLLLGECIYVINSTDISLRKSWVKICVTWFIMTMFIPEYAWFGGLLTAITLCMVVRKRKNSLLYLALAFIITILSVVGISALAQEKGSRDRIPKSIEATLLRRIAWPNFAKNSYFWGENIKSVIDDNKLAEISTEPENVLYVLGASLEEKYGKKEASILYWHMIETSFEMRTKEIAKSIGSDFASYICPQVAVQCQLSGSGVSYTGWNYAQMHEKAPVLTKYYMQYALKSWNVEMVLALLLILGSGIRKRRVYIESLLLPILTGASMILWYTMEGAGIQDYKKVMLVSAIWAIVIIKGISAGRTVYEEN